jgi:hypothetical protein
MSQREILVLVFFFITGLVIPLCYGVFLYKKGRKKWAIATFVSIPFFIGWAVTMMVLTFVFLALALVLAFLPFLLILKAFGVPIVWHGLFREVWIERR